VERNSTDNQKFDFSACRALIPAPAVTGRQSESDPGPMTGIARLRQGGTNRRLN